MILFLVSGDCLLYKATRTLQHLGRGLVWFGWNEDGYGYDMNCMCILVGTRDCSGNGETIYAFFSLGVRDKKYGVWCPLYPRRRTGK
jgi:hypothetical protein